MRKAPKIFAVVPMVLLAVAACSKSNPTRPLGSNPALQVPPAPWKVQLKSTCSAEGSAPTCVGLYGFTLLEDGSYQVGPAPGGQSWTGQLDSGEVDSLKAAVEPLTQGINTLLETQPICQAVDTEVVKDEFVTFSRGGEPREVSRYKGREFCHLGEGPEAASTLHQLVLQLARKYYPAPFPSDCLEQANRVEALYGPLTRCQADSDCVYLDNGYSPIPSDTLGYVALDNCTWIPTLPVGNALLVGAAQDQLSTALQQARQTCGLQITRPSCSGLRGFQSNSAPPVCDAGVCKVHPSVR
jgi:hypothetical protein